MSEIVVGERVAAIGGGGAIKTSVCVHLPMKRYRYYCHDVIMMLIFHCASRQM